MEETNLYLQEINENIKNILYLGFFAYKNKFITKVFSIKGIKGIPVEN